MPPSAPPGDGTAPASRRLRTDAERNRRRVLQAAGAAFRQHGLDVPVASVARRSGVGVATVYRRFPTRQALLDELLADAEARYAQVYADAAADPDPWAGLETALRRCAALQAAGVRCSPDFRTRFPEAVAESTARSRAALGGLLDRARASGRVREDVQLGDVVLLFDAVEGVLSSGADDPDRAAQRLVTHFLRSFEVRGGTRRR